MRTASRADLPSLAALFARANDAPYDLAVVAEEKCFEAGVGGEAITRVIERDGRIAGAAVTCGKWLRVLAVDREHRSQGIGSALLADAESRGALSIFAEPGNYFTPGVLSTDAQLIAFLRNRGYVETRSTNNLDAPLAALPSADNVQRATHDDAPRLLAFVEQHFGRIWRFEAARAFDRELPTFFYVEEAGAIAGFAVHDANNRGLACFGPTGVAEAMRGRGHGRHLLLASLAALRDLGHTNAVIPWTDALDFYRKSCGATVAHRFLTFAKQTEWRESRRPDSV
ncbi:MAG TPA: GNAT family N-acetyltransferase [Thermoanaerobaculia bacterium]|nr:GNAT family N-acetyltransferase [Thermoanaerobaculia bacterium]